MKKMFRPSIAYIRQLFKRKAKKKNEKRINNTAAARPATATTAVTTSTSSGGSHNPPDSSECYDQEPVWRSWSLVNPSSSSSSSEKGLEVEAQGGEQQSPLAQNARCAANKNQNKVSQIMEAWWMDPSLMGGTLSELHFRGGRRQGFE